MSPLSPTCERRHRPPCCRDATQARWPVLKPNTEVTMENDAAQQQNADGIAAQQMMCGMSDNPGQFREPAMSALFRQAWRERFGHRDGMDYLRVPF